ncbi:GIY-YIG nuclease family protein [Sphingomonas nostoxanthinifaciens]|uniref:GIY-YIG nuclease family protein n=1 Tax=Sphingomonas nostoxanthinifaciens TaxID=2872652 RepID=UPI001CC20F0B|nr:GIY-YIG nuclease family protein [Sphingomonas nostoxanthinifaciens]UAK25158.1 GIY-YIG nuclease family protein [Sphingomonas nostoxanthinifaciens]
MRETFQPAIDILASGFRGTLYIGCTSNLMQRMHQHREGLIPSFTRRYGVRRLAYCETFDTIDEAIRRERQLKEWRRAWKVALVERTNEHWNDLAIGFGFGPIVDCGSPVMAGVMG